MCIGYIGTYRNFVSLYSDFAYQQHYAIGSSKSGKYYIYNLLLVIFIDECKYL